MKLFVLVSCLSYLGFTAAVDCSESEIACADDIKCIPHRYICDSDSDCDDGSDENNELCEAWKNDECSRQEVTCKRLGEEECIQITEYCSLTNPLCQGDLDRRLCLMLEGGILKDLDNFVLEDIISPDNLEKSRNLSVRFRNLIPHTIRHIDCPPMYTLVGDQCLSIFNVGKLSWSESRDFCKILGGDLMSFRNISQFAEVVQHLQKYELATDFWVGGRIEDASKGWFWVDGTPMEIGSPFWATKYSTVCIDRNVTVPDSEESCFQYYQAPLANTKGQCASLSFELFFYMSDDDCVKKMSPICIYEGDRNDGASSFFSNLR